MGLKRFISKYFGLLTVILMVTSFTACVAAIPVVVYYKSKSHYVATVEINVDANKAYQAANEEVEARSHLKILEKKDSELFLEITDGKQTASVKVVSTGTNKTKLIVTADIEGMEQEKEKELAMKAVDIICNNLGVKYQLIEG